MPDAAKRDVTTSPASEPSEALTAGAHPRSAPAGAQGKRNLPQEWRLVRRAEFDAVYRQGRKRSSATFVVFLRPNGSETTRFGMSVKRALGNAVARNRIRRRVREILRLHREEFPLGWDVVIHPSRAAGTLKFAKLEAELLSLLPRDKWPDETGA